MSILTNPTFGPDQGAPPPQTAGPCPKCGQTLVVSRTRKVLRFLTTASLDMAPTSLNYRCVNNHNYDEKSLPLAQAEKARVVALQAASMAEWQKREAQRMRQQNAPTPVPKELPSVVYEREPVKPVKPAAMAAYTAKGPATSTTEEQPKKKRSRKKKAE